MLQQEILRLVHLVDDLGQLARAEAARTYLEKQQLRLTEAIGQLLTLYQPNFEQKRITASLSIEPAADTSYNFV